MSYTAVLDNPVFPDDKYIKVFFIKEEKSTANEIVYEKRPLIKVDQKNIKELKSYDPLLRNLEEKIYSIAIPEKWQKELVKEPNYLCKEISFKIARQLYLKDRYYPERIGASIEGGIMLHYINYINNKTLSIEIDNDLEIAALVNHEKSILKSSMIFNMNFNDILCEYA